MNPVPCSPVDDGIVLARIAVALVDGLADKDPVVEEPVQEAGWDNALLALEAGELAEMGIDLGSFGFTAGDLDALMAAEAADPREEEIPEVPVDPVTRPGDLWCLGSHRLLCGDATDPSAVSRLLDEIVPHLMVTDPPGPARC